MSLQMWTGSGANSSLHVSRCTMYFTCMSPCTHCGVSHCHLRVLDEEMGGLERLRGMSCVKQLESGRAVGNWASKLGLLPQRVQARKGIPQVLQGLPFSWGISWLCWCPAANQRVGLGLWGSRSTMPRPVWALPLV